MNTGSSWSEQLQILAAMGEDLMSATKSGGEPPSEQELSCYLYGQMAEVYMAMFVADPAHPDFWPIFGQVFSHFLPNPDTTYFHTPLEGGGIYRIGGYRGTSRMADFQVGVSQLLYKGEGGLHDRSGLGPTFAIYDLDSLVIDKKDGQFEVILSAERPSGHKGDWWPLDPQANYLLGRQVACDWVGEADGRFTIERLDTSPAKPRLTAQGIQAKLDRLAVSVEAWTRFSLDFVQMIRARGETNAIVRVNNYDAMSGVTSQRYIDGLFELDTDEALILETAIPGESRYWGFHLADEMWVTLDWAHRATSLNSHTAHLDDDGRLRIVIASTDPGTPNWLDTIDHRCGVISGRWTGCSDYPQPLVRKVKLADVRACLPASTPTVTPEQRDQALRVRRRGAQLRRRW